MESNFYWEYSNMQAASFYRVFSQGKNSKLEAFRSTNQYSITTCEVFCTSASGCVNFKLTQLNQLRITKLLKLSLNVD